jgi:hypothetical protein
MYIPDAEIELDMSTQPRCLSQVNVLHVICSCVVGQRIFLYSCEITDNGPLMNSVSVSAEAALDLFQSKFTTSRWRRFLNDGMA